MKNFQLPSLPDSCFGLSLGTTLEEFDGKMEKFDNRVLWFGDYGEGSRGGGKSDENEVEEVVNNLADTLHPVVSSAAPGSKERIEAMKEFYAGGDAESAFEITDEEIEDRLVLTFGKMLRNAESGGNSIRGGKQELKRERRRVSE